MLRIRGFMDKPQKLFHADDANDADFIALTDYADFIALTDYTDYTDYTDCNDLYRVKSFLVR